MLQINSMLNIDSDQSNAKNLFFSCLIFAEYQLDCMWGNKSCYNLELSLFIHRGDNTVSPLPLPTISWAKGDSSRCINSYFYKHVSAWATEIVSLILPRKNERKWKLLLNVTKYKMRKYATRQWRFQIQQIFDRSKGLYFERCMP